LRQQWRDKRRRVGTSVGTQIEVAAERFGSTLTLHAKKYLVNATAGGVDGFLDFDGYPLVLALYGEDVA
jgi:hypothetical protein